MVEFQLPKLITRVRFPSLAPVHCQWGIILSISSVFINGCVAIERPSPQGTVSVAQPAPAEARKEKPKGIYHKVKKGETLWRIAQTYGVAIGDIIRSNKIPDGAVIEENQLLLVPGK